MNQEKMMCITTGNQYNRTDYSVVDWNRTRRGKTVLEHLWSKVNRIDDLDSCWEWIGGKDTDGYGSVHLYGIGDRHTHSVFYYLAYGDIPDGHGVCHTCDNRPCVRSSHLFACTHVQNMRDMFKKERRHTRKGGNHVRAKLLEQDILFIRQEIDKIDIGKRAKKIEELAEQFSVSCANIYDVVSRRTWKHI